jgi:hypothetical protein
MRRRYTLPVVAALAALGGIAAVVVIAAGGSQEARLAPPAEDAAVLETQVTPSRYGFGDRLLAEVRLTIDRTRVDPESVVSVPVFRPFRRVGAIRVERTDLGDSTVLRFTYPLQCIDRACVPRGEEKELELPLGLVRYSPREGDVVTLPLEFPAVTVVTRLPADVRRDIVARPAALVADPGVDELPALGSRGGPLLLGWLLVGGAATIVLVLGGWLAWRLRPRREAEESAAPAGPALLPLPAALALVEASLGDGETERRVALDELARRLDESGEPDLAVEARRLAWSQAGPERERAAELAAAVRSRVDGEAHL